MNAGASSPQRRRAGKPLSRMATQQYRIRECGGMECGAVDEAVPIIPNVKLLGENSLNRRRYLPESVQPSEYEGKPVNLNHPDGPNKQRIVQERFAWIENARKEGADWRGDIHYNPEHPYAKQFAWWAKNNPGMVGLSHDAVGQGRTEGGIFVVEKVVSVKSVDLVADPATTKGLFESMDPELQGGGATGGDGESEDLDSLETHIKNAVAAICGDDSLDLKAKVKKIKAALKLLEEPGEEEEVEEDDEEGGDEDEEAKGDEDVEEGVKAALAHKSLRQQIAGLKKIRESLKAKAKPRAGSKTLREELSAVKAKLALRERQDFIEREIAKAKLPAVAVTPDFLELLAEAKDEGRVKKLIADRKAVASIQKPRSSGPIQESKGGVDDETWLKRIKG